MGFRFRRSIQLFPGFRLNLSRGGASVSVGPKGLRYTIGPKGPRATVGIPGTGLSWTEYSLHNATSAVNLRNGSEISETIQPLQNLETESVERVAALSTSELAPLLSAAKNRSSLVPFQVLGGLIVVAASLASGNNRYILISASYFAIFTLIAICLDRYRRSVGVTFETTGHFRDVSEALFETFSELRNCNSIWVVRAKGSTADWKRNAGASKLNDRKEIKIGFSRPTCIRASEEFASVQAGKQKLYFLPDALLIIKESEVTALAYQDVCIKNEEIRFIEEDAVPTDTPVMSYTWTYVNKAGGPDRRFNGNRQLPVCRYGEMSFSSGDEFSCVMQYSDPQKGHRFAQVIEVLSKSSSRMEDKLVNQIKLAKRWPSVAFIFASLVFCALLGVAIATENGPQPVEPLGDSSRSGSPARVPSKISIPPLEPSSARPAPRNLVPAPRQEQKSKAVMGSAPETQTKPVGSVRECLQIADIDQRIECLEQFRVHDQ